MDEPLLVPVSGKHVLKIALRVKKLIDTIVPIEFEECVISNTDSPILTNRVLQLLKDAAGGEGDGAPDSSSRRYRATLVFVLLIVRRWNVTSADSVLYDSGLYNTRALAAEYLACKLIDSEEDIYYLFRDMLCQRYTITLHKKDVRPLNALELAVNMHATAVIGSAGYQRCMQWIWNGWIVQSDEDPTVYTYYKQLTDTRFSAHFDPDRIKTPMYQNYLQLLISFGYLVLYTLCINTISGQGEAIGFLELLFYICTLGFVWDEVQKLYAVGVDYIGFWNVFNDTLYALVFVSFVLRALAVSHSANSPNRLMYDIIAYRTFACAAPLIWGRILLYLDSIQFFGAMLIVLKELMKESLIFFVLLIIISGGFLQAFIGLDTADDALMNFTAIVVKVMARTIIGGADFGPFEDFAAPYGEILYYCFTFLISTLLLNILVALFNSAYQKIYDNASSEYMALVAQKTLRFVRAPDENVFVAPFNLIELFGLILPLEWWLDRQAYQTTVNLVMTVIYSPALLFIAWTESKQARKVNYNRSKGFPDDANDVDQEWDLYDGYVDFDESVAQFGSEEEQMNRVIAAGDPSFIIDEESWLNKVSDAAPPLQKGDKVGVAWNHYTLYQKMDELTKLVESLKLELEKKK